MKRYSTEFARPAAGFFAVCVLTSSTGWTQDVGEPNDGVVGEAMTNIVAEGEAPQSASDADDVTSAGVEPSESAPAAAAHVIPSPIVPVEFGATWVLDTVVGSFLGLFDCRDCFTVTASSRIEAGVLTVKVDGANVAFMDEAVAEVRVAVHYASGAEQIFVVAAPRNPGVGVRGPGNPTLRGQQREFALLDEPIASLSMKGNNQLCRKSNPVENTWMFRR